KTVVHECTYNWVIKDSIRIFWQDSTYTYITADSQMVCSFFRSSQDKGLYKVGRFYNDKKLLVKEEKYKDDNLAEVTEYAYNDKKRMTVKTHTDKLQQKSSKQLYEYSVDKASGDEMVSTVDYEDNRIMFYTRAYYNKKGQKYKEVRLNDNNKDVIHVEKFFYTASGKLKGRSVFFNEFNVTKEYQEAGDDLPEGCSRTLPVNIPDKFTASGKIGYIRKLLKRNITAMSDATCHKFDFRFTGKECDVRVFTTGINNINQAVVTYREKL
ncbi:MAG: hypothetical protein EBZ77_04915, partial [Chitinophagia bacterium]|nr:hypothetical protein [Chitinophagia bacterium]